MSNFVFNGTSSDELGVRIISRMLFITQKYDITLVSIQEGWRDSIRQW